MAVPRSLLIALVTASAAAAGPATASAALPWAPCTPAGFECTSLSVPVDRSGAVPGTVGLNLTRVPAASNPGRVAVVALAGGPGQAAVPIAPDFAKDLGPALATRDLLVFDQRGTGRSGALSCPALAATSGSLVAVTRACSEQLGAQRAFYRTPDSVADLEAIRVAGGYEKLALYGVSYGTKVALAYASAHPDRVESLLLDSVVTPEGPDALRRSSLQATPRVAREICARSLCRGVTPSVADDLAAFARKLRGKRLSGPVYSATGHRSTASLTESGLFAIMLAGDLNPTLRAELPGSLRAALRRDYGPLLRLSRRSAGLANAVGHQTATQTDSFALLLATTCEENPTLPWTRGAPPEQKAREAEAAARALPDGSTGPFSSTVALRQGVLPLCLGWMTASPAPVADGPLPTVPTLVIDGRSDVRTPLEDATQLAQRIPGAQLLPVPNVGHSVVGSDPTHCSTNAITAFYAGQAVAQCDPASVPRFLPTPRPPTRAAGLRAYGHVRGRPGRTVEALRRTVNDAQSQVLGAAIASGSIPAGAGGLRSGYVKVVKGGLSLRRYQYVPGILVSGTLRDTGTSSFTVSGTQAARGTLRVTRTLQVSGRLGGRRISTRFGKAAAAASRPYGGLTLAQAVARGKRIRAAVG